MKPLSVFLAEPRHNTLGVLSTDSMPLSGVALRAGWFLRALLIALKGLGGVARAAYRWDGHG